METMLSSGAPAPEERDAFTVYEEIVAQLSTVCLGQPDTIRRLALIGTAHLLAPSGTPGAVRWVIGPSDSGKSTLLRAFAEALELPAITLGAPRLTATGWAGTDVEEAISTALATVIPGTREWLRPVLILDDAQHLRMKSVADTTDRSHQVNRQTSLLDILGGTGTVYVRVVSGSPPVLWSTSECLRIVAGAFDLTPVEAVSPAVLEERGFIPELANRLAQPAVHLRPLDSAGLAALLLRHQGGPIQDLFRSLGGDTLTTDRAAAADLAKGVGERPGATPRTALLLLEALWEEKILQALASGELSLDRPPLRIQITRSDLVGLV